MDYIIKRQGGHHEEQQGLDASIDVARLALQVLRGRASGEAATFTVENKDGYLLASVTNRRIVGTFQRQRWSGPKQDLAIPEGEKEDFDATDAVLLLSLEELQRLADHDTSSDALGLRFIRWDGPCEVAVVEAICDYFGVGELSDITEEALAFARQEANPQPPVEEVVTLSIRVKIRRMPTASQEDFVNNLEYFVESCTPGVRVLTTEIADKP